MLQFYLFEKQNSVAAGKNTLIQREKHMKRL